MRYVSPAEAVAGFDGEIDSAQGVDDGFAEGDSLF